MRLSCKDIAALSSHAPLQVRSGHSLECASWLGRIWRIISPAFAQQEDAKVRAVLDNALLHHIHEPKVMKAIERRAISLGASDLTHQAMACRIAPALQLSVNDLLSRDNRPTQLMQCIQNNHLQRIVPLADSENSESAFVYYNNEWHIKSPEGASLITTAEGIDAVVARNPKDREALITLKKLLASGELEAAAEMQKRFGQKYAYLPISEIPLLDNGQFDGKYYMAHGLTNHDQTHWREVQPALRRSGKPQYTFRVVTQIPEYALPGSIWQRIALFFSHAFSAAGNGHSWIEIDQPGASDEQLTYVAGYFLHLDNHKKRICSPDPRRYTPIKPNRLSEERYVLSEAQANKALLYLKEVQKMIDRRDKHLLDTPQTPDLSDRDRKNIRLIYSEAMKGTCLSFANAFRFVITGEEADDRSGFRQTLFPRWLTNILGSINDPITDAIGSRYMVHTLLTRAQLPMWVHTRFAK